MTSYFLEYQWDYNDIWKEMLEIHKEVRDMDNSALVEEVEAVVDELDQDILMIVHRFEVDKVLTKPDRDKLVAYYVLNFGEMEFEE
jgi:hypothetical protein